jgi:hypothetical protein
MMAVPCCHSSSQKRSRKAKLERKNKELDEKMNSKNENGAITWHRHQLAL